MDHSSSLRTSKKTLRHFEQVKGLEEGLEGSFHFVCFEHDEFILYIMIKCKTVLLL